MDRIARNRERRTRRREAWFRDKVCAVCGGTENLELDHIDPATKHPSLIKDGYSNCHIWAWSDERRAVELMKCQPLCKTCHDAKTGASKRLPEDERHGVSGYNSRGCRCDICKEANRVYRAERKARRGSR